MHIEQSGYWEFWKSRDMSADGATIVVDIALEWTWQYNGVELGQREVEPASGCTGSSI